MSILYNLFVELDDGKMCSIVFEWEGINDIQTDDQIHKAFTQQMLCY